MYPWTTPPTSWPTPPQPPNASSTWPPSTPLAHLFGQPSPLQPTWSSSSSLMTPASTTPSLSFASLATAPHAIPTPHLVPTTTTPLIPDTTVVHTAPQAFTTPTAPTVPTTWHATPAPSHASTTPPTPLPSSPYPPRTLHSPPLAATATVPPAEPRHPAVKAAPKLRSEKKPDKLRRSTPKATPATLPATPPEPTTASSPPISPELAALGTTTQHLAESVRLLHAQQQMILDSQRAQEQRQQLLNQSFPTTGPTLPSPSPTPTPPTPMLPPAPKARPIEPEAPTLNAVSTPPVAIPHPPTSPSRRPRSRTRRSRSHRPSAHSHHRPPSLHRTPRSPLPRHRSSTKHDKSRRTPSPYRRRSPPRRRSPADHRRHRSPPRPRSELLAATRVAVQSCDQPHVRPIQASFLHLMLMTLGANGTTATTLQTTIAAPLDLDPLLDHHHLIHHQIHQQKQQHQLEPCPFVYLTVKVKTRMQRRLFLFPNSTKMTSNSVNLWKLPMIHIVYDASPSWTPITQYPSALHWISPKNSSSTTLWMRCSPSWPSHIVLPTMTLYSSKRAKLPSSTLPRPSPNPDYLTSSWQGERGPFMWNRRTCWPSRCQRDCPKNRSIVVNTQALNYLIYHKTSWESVAKILAEDCIRPATWTKNEAGYPTQYPCYGFFGMSSEIADIDDLSGYAVKLCTSQLYKIGKGQNPSGLLAICRSPKCIRALSGGNDQIQRLCNLQGIAKGKDNATAMNSSAASICYVASTHSVFPGLITHTSPDTRPPTVAAPSELPDNPPADREPPARPNPTTDLPAPSHPPPTDSRATTTHHETTDHAAPDQDRRHWNNNPYWDDTTYTHRDRRSSYREGYSRDHHREGYARSRTSAHNSSRSRW